MKTDQLRWYGFASVAFGVFMATLDFSALTVALPKIARDFQAVIADVEWVVMAYVLTTGALLLPLGKGGDHWGKHKVFKIGFLIFIVSSVLCAFSQGIYQLIICRVLQGIGGAIYLSVGTAILVEAFPASARGKVIGFMGSVASLGLMFGAPLGGLLTHYISWRAIFFINVPIGLAGLAWAHRFLPRDALEDNRFRFDFRGAFLSIVASGSLLCVLSRLPVWGIKSYYIWGAFSLFVVSSLIFFYVERNNPYSVLDFNLFRNRVFAFGNASLLLYFVSINVVYFLCPFYLAEVLHYSHGKVGLVMMAIPIAFVVLNPVSGWLSDKIGTRLLAPLGLLIGVAAYMRVGQLSEFSSQREVIFSLLLVGISSGFFQAPNSSGIFGSVPGSRLGTASAFLHTMRNYGTVIGIAAATMIFSFRVKAHNGVDTAFSIHELPPSLFVKAFQDTLWLAAVVAIAALFCSTLRGHDTQRHLSLSKE